VWFVDVSEESEHDLLSERFGYGYGGSRSSHSRSPDSLRFMRSERKSSSLYNLVIL